MTWVVAASTLFGYGALYSDVRVTFRDGTERDLVQKAYPMGNYIAGGFAGSIKLGFMLLQSLADSLAASEDEIDRVVFDPVPVAIKWSPLARSIFLSAEAEERRLGSRFLLLGISPTEACGLGAKVYFVRFASPDYQPKIMSRPIKICGIGTGAEVAAYKYSIKPLFRLTSGILKAEVRYPGGWGHELGFAIANALAWHPQSGISRHLHMIIVERGRIRVANSDENIYPADGTKIEVRMPRVAQGYEEFLAFAHAVGQNGAGAVC
jgi:hypothetical protein